MSAPDPIVPRKFRRGDTVRVVAPARSRKFVTEHDHSAVIEKRLAALGLRLTFGDHVDQRDDFGGFNSNELLPYLDWDLIAANPKIFCGFSDITAVQNAILARTGMVTYSGPHWSSFGMRDYFEQTEQWFVQALLGEGLAELLQLPDASGVQGLVIGRFQEASRVTRSLLEQIIACQDRLAGLPVLANVDLGHTDPRITFPIGGRAALAVGASNALHIADS